MWVQLPPSAQIGVKALIEICTYHNKKGGKAVTEIPGLKISISDKGHGTMSLTDYENTGFGINDSRFKRFFRQAKSFPSFYLTAIRNRLRFLQDCEIDFRKTFCPTLDLGDKIAVIDKHNQFMFQESGVLFKSRFRFDSVITDVPDLPLMFYAADCPIVILFDRRKAFAKFHSGRENTLKNIAGKTARKMEEKFFCRPADIVAYFPSPYICEECHFLTFLGFNLEDREARRIKPAISEEKGGWKLDLRKAIEIQLRSEGVEQIIPNDPGCTLCNGGNHFSHRGWTLRHPHHTKSGRFAVVTVMRNV
ncbi:MAG: hypothetical protein A3J76_01700 [Candidatus Moranbacteria bacterium RBG_13_45_13]|nr:MAG: hypothetical protein A3J76_01700 [Candidatus Moranbacteria bacterium RBG_13_45_13]